MSNNSTKVPPTGLQRLSRMAQFIIFLIIQIPLLPLTIMGYIFTVVKALLYSKKYGMSFTATSPLAWRWLLHKLGKREDTAVVEMISSLPSVSTVGLWLIFGPVIIANRICGYTPTFATFPEPEKVSLMSIFSFKTAFFDKSMEKNIDSVDQVVFMGAGFDTRAFKYCKKNVKVFELDQENIQKYKVKALKKARIDYEWITFVPIDFKQESWVDKLVENGFDTEKKTFFLWEGVIPYLEEESVKQTLKAVAESSGRGSVITFDFSAKSFISGTGGAPFIMKYYGKPFFKMVGEPFKFGIDTSKNPRKEVETLLKEAGLTLRELSFLGETTKKKPFGGLVEAVKR